MSNAFKIDDWKWNIWEVDVKTGQRKTWLGSITDPKTGFAWIAKHGGGRRQFAINNVPPATSTMQTPPFEVYATDDDTLHRGDDLEPRTIPGKYDDFEPRKKREVKRSKKPRVIAGRDVSHPAPARLQGPAKKAAPKTKAQKKLEADAKALLDQHKADEAAEMSQE